MSVLKRSAQTTVLAGISALVLSACGQGEATSTDVEVEVEVSEEALVSEGNLTVCAALSMGLPPNYHYDEANEATGMEVELAEQLAARMGLETVWVDVPFASIIPSLQASQCDTIISSLYIRPEREEVVDFVPYMWQGQGIAVSAENEAGITGPDDSLCGHSVATTIGTTAEQNMDDQADACAELGADLEVVKFDNATNAAQSVTSGQQVALASETPTISYREQQTDGELVLTGDPYGMIQVGAATLPENTELSAALETALEALQEDGTYEELLGDYNQADMNIAEDF
ncbi:ABC transporter substrate-binding protein [Nesterenkonia aurantiaca]|uniref:Amino acid ABC transporter substrate-binding protein (PAAT family) n=1 Tax=Nesterenkonia aurantiaca TaxID=1436010 RepID=A0A4R7G8E0_9MICC|nr:ABC transporter substrate-binding protein [Nesterenkonia aurantiaca]TDS87780.1 amino acid ABC transporter substrate-binding protein (PAAT family) [Nesterenkonia aurantiaca]